MNRRACCAAFALTLLPAAGLATETPDLSGTWRLDPSRTRAEAAAPLAGLIAAGGPDTLHVSQPANGTLVVESQVNESHARLYVPGSESRTPIYLGQPGHITMATRWDGARLVSEGRRETGDGAADVKEVYGLSADGEALELEITVKAPGGESRSRLVYTRIDDTGPCESWPTPCKSPK